MADVEDTLACFVLPMSGRYNLRSLVLEMWMMLEVILATSTRYHKLEIRNRWVGREHDGSHLVVARWKHK